MNMELKFKEQVNSFVQNRNEMNVSVDRKEIDNLTCPNCGSKIKLNTEKLDEIISLNNNIQDTITVIKITIENIINISTNNTINIQLKMVKTLFDTINEDISKSNSKLKSLLKEFMIEKKFQNIKLNEVKNKQELILEDGRYVGQVINGKAEGKGILYFDNGVRYEGDFKNNLLEGKGIMYWNNGDRYQGEYKNGAREGKGIYYFKNGDRFEGEWIENKKNHQSIMQQFSLMQQQLISMKQQLSQINQNMKNLNINTINNQELKYDDGRYIGQVVNGKPDRKGIYYYNNGDRQMGDYKNGKPIGKFIRLTKNGEVKTINY